jgi:hypothetical protein
MKRVCLVVMIFSTALALSAPAALAKPKGGPKYVPPNQSAASQYTEDVPTAGGNTPSSGVGGRGGGSSPGPGSGAGSISAKTLHQLDQSGSTGAAAASLARSLAPVRRAPALRPAASTTSGVEAGAPAAQVIKTLGGSDAGGGIGFLLPAILVISLLVATGLGLMRIRRSA